MSPSVRISSDTLRALDAAVQFKPMIVGFEANDTSRPIWRDVPVLLERTPTGWRETFETPVRCGICQRFNPCPVHPETDK